MFNNTFVLFVSEHDVFFVFYYSLDVAADAEVASIYNNSAYYKFAEIRCLVGMS